MKPRESVIRARQFQVEELRRQLSQFDRMITDFRAIRSELSRQIEIEEVRTQMSDPAHFAYSTVARAARERRSKLDASILELEERRTSMETELSAALEFLNAFFAGPPQDAVAQTDERSRRVRAA